mgnify:CR=1 FL=1
MESIVGYQTAAQIRNQVNLIQSVMKAVMKKDVHYGIIPGCDKPSLYKPGAEKLLSTFQISVEPEVIDLSTPDEARYRVLAHGVYRNTGVSVGTGIGECSSNEEKYKWRRASCDEEFDAAPEDRKRIKWGKTRNGGAYQVKQVRTEIADVANTILKMAKKRAQIDLTLTSTAASDIFTQDIEDLPEEMRETVSGEGQPEIKRPETTKKAEDIPACADCGKPVADNAEEAARVVGWCNKNFGGRLLCRACQAKAKKAAEAGK